MIEEKNTNLSLFLEKKNRFLKENVSLYNGLYFIRYSNSI